MDTVVAKDPRKLKMRWWTLAVLALSLTIVVVDNTIVNVALPTLQQELGATASALQWIVDSYILVFAGSLLAMGALGDRFGRKRTLQIGLVTFGAASAVAAYTQSSGQLIAARGVMGIGGALIMPSTLSVIVDVFPREERAKAIGVWTAVAGLGVTIGPVLGGWLLGHFWWGAVFLINVPIVGVALGAGLLLVPESRDPQAGGVDVRGMALSAGALAALVYAIIEAPAWGWLDPAVLGGLAVAMVMGATFVLYELGAAHPMLDVRLFKNPRFAAGTSTILVAALALAGLTFTLSQYLQVVRGYTAFEAGTRMIPVAIGLAVGARRSSLLVARLGTRKVAAGGLLIAAAALVGISMLGTGTQYWVIGVALTGMGIGLGSAFVPATDAVMAAVPEAKAGVGSAVNDTARQIGYAIGVGVAGSVLNAVYSVGVRDGIAGLPAAAHDLAQNSVGGAAQVAASVGGPLGDSIRTAANAAFVDAFGAAMLVAAGVAIGGSLLVLRFMPDRDPTPVPQVLQTEDTTSPSVSRPPLSKANG